MGSDEVPSPPVNIPFLLAFDDEHVVRVHPARSFRTAGRVQMVNVVSQVQGLGCGQADDCVV